MVTNLESDPFEYLPAYPEPDNFYIARTDTEVVSAAQLMYKAQPKVVGFDIETYNERSDIWKNVASLFPYIGGKVRTAQIAFKWLGETFGIVIDLKSAPEYGHRFLKRLLECDYNKRTIVGHNLAFEFLYMETLGIRTTADIFDTNIAARILSSNLLPLEPKRGKGFGLDLGSCAGRDLGKYLDKDEQTSNWGGDLTDSQLAYAVKDALVVLDLMELYQERLQETKQTEVAKVDFRVLPIMAACNANGITVDIEKIKQAKIYYESERERLHNECCEILGVENPNSPKQLLPVFQAMDPEIENTNKQSIEYLARKNPKVNKLIELKKTVKIIGTYIEPWLKMAELTGGTVHPNLRAIGADTGRMSCPTAFKGSVPSGTFTKTGKEKTQTIILGATLHGAPNNTRDFFVSRPGYVMIDADFSAIEVRLAAYMYDDPAMIELALNADIDAHRRMASKIFGVAEEEVTSDQRKVGKTANFALQYGCGVNKLHAQLESVLGRKVHRSEAERAYEAWHQTHYKISQRMMHFRQKDKPILFLRSPLGRVMGLPDPIKRPRKNKWNQKQPCPAALIHTNGVNWPIQSAGRDLLAESAILVWHRLITRNPDVKPLHLVHDEILIEVPENFVDEAITIIKGCMSDPTLQKKYLGDIPLECEVLSGKRWSEVH